MVWGWKPDIPEFELSVPKEDGTLRMSATPREDIELFSMAAALKHNARQWGLVTRSIDDMLTAKLRGG